MNENWKHGSTSTYTNKGCRCDECREAIRLYNQELRRRQGKRVGEGRGRKAGPDQHGTISQYFNRGCRCDECKQAVRDYRAAKRAEGLPEGDPRHGTLGGYYNYGCRCAACGGAARDYNSRFKYGLPESDRTALWEGQGERCASCGDPEPEDSQRRFHIDHDHETGAVRGILCHSCNVSLGHLRDDPERIRALADYIERWRESLPY